jgi:hypothetical protein
MTLPRITRRILTLALLLCALSAGGARADALTPGLDPLTAPATTSSAAQSATPATPASGPRCTIATAISDIGTNDTYLARVTFLAPELPLPGKAAVCPAGAAQEAARRALAACKLRASNPYNCVYADMNRMFEITTELVDTSEIGAQCPSYSAKYLGIACQPGDLQDSCNVGCGTTQADAISAAVKKCQAEHQGDCALTNVIPVETPAAQKP